MYYTRTRVRLKRRAYFNRLKLRVEIKVGKKRKINLKNDVKFVHDDKSIVFTTPRRRKQSARYFKPLFFVRRIFSGENPTYAYYTIFVGRRGQVRRYKRL